MSVQSVYIALFGRPADPGGLAYWNEVTNNGQNLAPMLAVLPSLPEYTSRFEGMNETQVITTIYQNLFGREPDADGLAFFTNALQTGAQSIATIAVNILDGAQGDDLQDVVNKEAAANLFTESLDTPEEIAAYTGDVAAQGARAFLNNVDAENPATPDSVNHAIDAVEAGDPNGGQEPEEEEPEEPTPVDPGPTQQQLDVAQADAIADKWHELDAAYVAIATAGGNSALFGDYDDDTSVDSPYGETLGEAALAVNTAFVQLGLEYATLIERNPSVALVDEIAKDTADRSQSIHDNLLGNIRFDTLTSRALLSEFQDEVQAIDNGAYGVRAYYDGNTAANNAAHDAVRAFDWEQGIHRNDWTDEATNSGLDASAREANNMWNGNGVNALSGFTVTRHEGAGIELALRARGRQDATGVTLTDAETGTYSAKGGLWDRAAPSSDLAFWNFEFSIATGLNGAMTNLDDFEFYLLVDTDPGAGVSPLRINLTDVDKNGRFESFSYTDGTPAFADNAGEGSVGTTVVHGEKVAQNSQNFAFGWINSLINQANGATWNFTNGKFDIALFAEDDGGNLLASSEIVVLVGADGALPVGVA